jgi:hypothetical protein
MPIFQFKCERCHKVEDRLYASFKQMCLEKAVRCVHDGSRMERIASTSSFSVGGFNAANHYGVKQ